MRQTEPSFDDCVNCGERFLQRGKVSHFVCRRCRDTLSPYSGLPVRKELRKEVARGGKLPNCSYCGNQLIHYSATDSPAQQLKSASWDHVIPVSRGGKCGPKVWACRGCNNEKGNLTATEYRLFRHYHYTKDIPRRKAWVLVAMHYVPFVFNPYT